MKQLLMIIAKTITIETIEIIIFVFLVNCFFSGVTSSATLFSIVVFTSFFSVILLSPFIFGKFLPFLFKILVHLTQNHYLFAVRLTMLVVLQVLYYFPLFQLFHMFRFHLMISVYLFLFLFHL